MADAERALAKGQAQKALSWLEAAALLQHSADTEMLQIRAMLAAGEYRQATAFAAHTAGAHVDEGITPNAIYAWLLDLGGQGKFAMRMLDEALAREPGNPIAQEVKRRMSGDPSPPSAQWFATPHRLAPYEQRLAGGLPPTYATVSANGVLWDGGKRGLVPVRAIDGAAQIWVRNGLGQTVSAKVERRIASVELAVLKLSKPISMGLAAWASREPFGGSPGFAADYPTVSGSAPSWPRITPGFLGGQTLSSPSRRLGIALRTGPRGGPVFDGYGRIVGVAMAAPAGGDSFVTVSQIRAALGLALDRSMPGSASASFPLDESYERALRVALQVIVR